MRVIWSRQSLEDRDAIWRHIASDNPLAANRVDAAFEEAVDGLAEFPELGRPGLVSGTRELFPVHGYRIVYELNGQEVWVLTIASTSRLWP